MIRERITSILQRLVRLREGEFGFNVSDAPPDRIGERDLSAETLDDGIHPEGLMLDLARQLDEDRRESTAAIEAPFSAPLPPEAHAGEELLEELALDARLVPTARRSSSSTTSPTFAAWSASSSSPPAATWSRPRTFSRADARRSSLRGPVSRSSS